MFETRKKLYEVLLKYINEIGTIISTAEADYEEAFNAHGKHLSDETFDDGDLAREEDMVQSIFDFLQDTKCELDILIKFRYEMFSNWPAALPDNEEETENEH